MFGLLLLPKLLKGLVKEKAAKLEPNKPAEDEVDPGLAADVAFSPAVATTVDLLGFENDR